MTASCAWLKFTSKKISTSTFVVENSLQHSKTVVSLNTPHDRNTITNKGTLKNETQTKVNKTLILGTILKLKTAIIFFV